MKNEAKNWEKVIELTNKLNIFILNELKRNKPDENIILKTGLQLIPQLISGADILSIRLIDKTTNEIQTVAVYSRAWKEGSSEENNWKENRRYHFEDINTSISGSVIKTKQTTLVDRTIRNDDYRPFFDKIKKVVYVPLITDNEVHGVLDVGTENSEAFLPEEIKIIEFVAQQLAVYYTVLKTFSDTKRLKTGQITMFEDFAHQIRSPFYQLAQRLKMAQDIADTQHVTLELRKILNAAVGLAEKAKRAVGNMNLFAKLSNGEALYPTLQYVSLQNLELAILRIVNEYRILAGTERGIEIMVTRIDSISLGNESVKIDSDLFDQVVICILDNAIKYSYADTIINIMVAATNNSCKINFINKGLIFTREEIDLSKKRGYRGRNAKLVTGEGSGIGLWIANNIMNAFNGELKIEPTNAKGLTEISLILPLIK